MEMNVKSIVFKGILSELLYTGPLVQEGTIDRKIRRLQFTNKQQTQP